jgi:putative transposase
VRSAYVHAVGLAMGVFTHARGWSANSAIARVRLAERAHHAESERSMLAEEIAIKDARVAAIAPRERPHYPPEARLRILALRAARGWTIAETARRFLVSVTTVSSWMARLDEEGEAALVRTPEPINRYPDFVRAIVGAIAVSAPALGKVRIAQMLARAGLHLAASTVGRMRRKRTPRRPSGSPRLPQKTGRVVTARRPHEAWHVDLTLLPTSAGFWAPWFPFAILQRWPFCFWLGVVLDHFSRSVVAWRLFREQPSAEEIVALLERARRSAGATPKSIVCDRGPQFRDDFHAWCTRRGIRPRFGAIGQHGSIAVIERFFRSLKTEMLRRLASVPLADRKMGLEIAAYVRWYNAERPHQGLGGRTPDEVREGGVAARDERALEPRARYPIRKRAPRKHVQNALVLALTSSEGRTHLPVVRLHHAA